jgi:hypothetical protein
MKLTSQTKELLYSSWDITQTKIAEAKRHGKKSVALVGMASTSCELAPFDDPNIEIWGCNEMYVFPWMKRADRWFQIHTKDSWSREVAKRGIRGHKEWLMRNEWNIPIYMQRTFEEVPNSIPYPLKEVCDRFFKNFRRGTDVIKYLNSTFAYYMGVALLEGFQRIEIYGFEMVNEIEYTKQRDCAHFWIGMAMGMGVEIYTPPGCNLMTTDIYGGNEQGEGWNV